jgi:hypothetical protein
MYSAVDLFVYVTLPRRLYHASHQYRIDLCNRALEAVGAAIPADFFRDAHDYINRFDEWLLGMEVLIDQLAEFGIKISREQFGLIQVAIDSMGLGGCDRVVYLREHGVLCHPPPTRS